MFQKLYNRLTGKIETHEDGKPLKPKNEYERKMLKLEKFLHKEGWVSQITGVYHEGFATVQIGMAIKLNGGKTSKRKAKKAKKGKKK